MNKYSYAIAVFFSVLLLAGCVLTSNSQDNGRQVAKGTLVSVGKSHLIMESQEHYMFVNVGPESKERLSHVKKGETIILLGKQGIENGKEITDVDTIVLEDGTHIPAN